MFTTAFSLALLPLLTIASPNPQYAYNPPSAPSSSASSAAASASAAPPSTSNEMKISVNADFTFTPANVTAANGTLVTFTFLDTSTVHSVTQGDFASPCVPMPSGFDSDLTTGGMQWTLNVTNDQIPIYFFCKAPAHCGLGMVGAINAPKAGGSFDAWQAAALAVGPKEKPVMQTGFASGGVGAIATAPPATSSSSSSSASPSSTDVSGSSKTNGAFGLTVSGVAATMFGLAVAMFVAA